jgi:VRR-NUC domain
MKSLKYQKIGNGKYPIICQGQKIAIATWTIRFPKWNGAPLGKSLKNTYRVKPLVEVNGEPLFGELAILRWLQKDGWDGVWVDTFHGKKLFWNGLPDRTRPCLLPAKAEALYDKIVAGRHGKAGGFFDVFAWRGQKRLFVESKGEGDKLKKNQLLWIRAAIKSGVSPSSLLLVEFKNRTK